MEQININNYATNKKAESSKMSKASACFHLVPVKLKHFLVSSLIFKRRKILTYVDDKKKCLWLILTPLLCEGRFVEKKGCKMSVFDV